MPATVHLFHLNIRVQVYFLPVGCMNEVVGKQIGDFIGIYVKYDAKNFSSFWR